MAAPFLVAVLVIGAIADPLPSTPAQIAVLDLAPASPADRALASATSAALVEVIAALPQLVPGTKVLGAAELDALIAQQSRSQLMGCEDERCMADLSRAVAADRVVMGRVGVVAGEALLFLSLLDPQESVVIARASRAVPVNAAGVRAGAADAVRALLAPAARDALRLASLSLVDPAAARATGDAPLEELRLAVLFDELGEDGAALRMPPVETCAQKQLLDAGATVVAPAVVQRIKGIAGPRAVLDGVIPEALTAEEVDALVVGVVEYRTGPGFGGATSAEVDLSMQLVKIDTGDVLASEQQQARHPGHTFNAAQKAAAGRLCAQVGPLLSTALKKRASRGARVVVEVEGASAEEAGQLATLLEATKRVARVKVKSVSPKGAVLDVIVAGGDGVTLALELPRLKLDRPTTKASAGLVSLGRLTPVAKP